MDITGSEMATKNWVFETKKEADLADALAAIAEDTGISCNDLTHMFPLVLRMLKSKSQWSN